MWGDVDNSSFWSLGALDKASINDKLQRLERSMFLTRTLFSIIGTIFIIQNKKTRVEVLLFYLLFLVIFLFISLLKFN